MKKLIFFLLILLSTQYGVCQLTKQEYLSTPVTWFGIDYSRIELVGDGAFNSPKKVVEIYFDAWNNMVYSEAGKYNLARFLMKKDININLKLVEMKNHLVDSTQLIKLSKSKLRLTEVDDLLHVYDFDEFKGLGALLIAEYYDKTFEEASYVFVLFDIDTREVRYTKRYFAYAMGFGFRNYWAKTFHSTLEGIEFDLKHHLRKGKTI